MRSTKIDLILFKMTRGTQISPRVGLQQENDLNKQEIEIVSFLFSILFLSNLFLIPVVTLIHSSLYCKAEKQPNETQNVRLPHHPLCIVVTKAKNKTH